MQKEYREAKKNFNLSTQTLKVMRDIRSEIDGAGGRGRQMISAVDGSFCNKTIFKADSDRTVLIARCRKDAKLCRAAGPGGRRKYSSEKFTPEKVRKDSAFPWKQAKIWFGGKARKIRFKEVKNVLWQRGAGLKLLRLLVIAPQPCKLSPNAKT
ncbi:MAG: hypothetical protein HZA01_03485 [Nitrospinae bacterium]|nr:hypothetical protein [Nitrospinota bacterium]